MPGPQPRACVSQIPAYVAGKPPQPRAGLTTYKLSSNENPYPPLPGVLEAARPRGRADEPLPRHGQHRAVRRAVRRARRARPSTCRSATGSVALIYQLLQAFCDPGDEVVYAWRSLRGLPDRGHRRRRATSVQVPVLADGRHDLDAMAAAVTDRTKVVMVCTPNNPTGPSVTQAELDAFLAQVPVARAGRRRRGVRRVRADGRRRRRPRDRTARTPTSWSTRTFSKAYGLAGFRVGYAVAPAPIAAALRAVSLPFGVSGVAQAAAIASLAAEAELLERVEALVAERTRVLTGLRGAGWDVPEAQGNFVWFALGERTADFAAAADELGIVVRPFAGDGARVSHRRDRGQRPVHRAWPRGVPAQLADRALGARRSPARAAGAVGCRSISRKRRQARPAPSWRRSTPSPITSSAG